MLVRRQQIGADEIIGAMVPYLTCPELLAGRAVIHWIDNTSAIAGLAKGYARSPDSARLVHYFHAWCARIGANVWFEYVPSAANVADAPSREIERLSGARWRLAGDAVSVPRAVIFPEISHASARDAWMREARAAERAPAEQP